LLHFNQT